MGVVYLGEADDEQQVAVKMLRPEYADDGETRARFRREVKAMARVRNRYTVRVLDADPGSPAPYLATEFADGLSLDEHVKIHGPLPPEAVVTLAAALAEALTAIHAADVMHRDLKPSNMLLTSTGPVVIDFGIAQTADTVPITRTGMTIGSPGYMAPEQTIGHASLESDIFAWALVVAFAASGQPPFGTGPAIAVLHRVLNDAPDVSAVPPRLMPLVTSALAKDPARRPTAADLLRDLSPDSVTGAAGPGSRPRRRRVAAVALPVAAALAAVGGVLLTDSGLHPGVRAPRHADTRPATAGAARSPSGARPDAGAIAESAAPATPAASPRKPRSAPASTPSASPSPVSSVTSPPSSSSSPVSSASGSSSPVSSPSSSPSASPDPSGSSAPASSGSTAPSGSGSASSSGSPS
jgi:serine/threonine protein kinase